MNVLIEKEAFDNLIKKVDETNYAVILDDKVKKSKTSSFFK
jgi:hypothetical protein